MGLAVSLPQTLTVAVGFGRGQPNSLGDGDRLSLPVPLPRRSSEYDRRRHFAGFSDPLQAIGPPETLQSSETDHQLGTFGFMSLQRRVEGWRLVTALLPVPHVAPS